MYCGNSGTCASVTCSCSDGTSQSSNDCYDQFCVTTCPANDLKAGAKCFDDGCTCESQTCDNGTHTCCATTGTLPAGSACAVNCDCHSGQCVSGSCW